MDHSPTASIVIPTRDRLRYLEVAIASLAPQARKNGAEILIVNDGESSNIDAFGRKPGTRVLRTKGQGANAARNVGIAAASAELIVLIDDDVCAPPTWLAAMLDGIAAQPEYGVFGGPIRASLEGGGPLSCGRDSAPITTLDLGPDDRDADLVWSANMAIRRAALEQVGPFDETILGRGEEEDWERRYVAVGGRIRYLAGAGLEHRRTGRDAHLSSLSRSAYTLGRTARRYDRRKGTPPTLSAEARTLAGCLGHVVRYRCPNMLTGAAHSAGRIHEAVSEQRT